MATGHCLMDKRDEDMTLITAENKNIWFYCLKCKGGTCLNTQFTWFAFYMLFIRGTSCLLERWS